MTFAEWCDETARQTETNISRALVKEIMTTAIRVAVDEFLAKPADATLDIGGIGRFYLNRATYDMSKRFHLKDRAESNDIVHCWNVHFRASRALKEVLNHKRDIKDFKIGYTAPLYNIEDIQEDGTVIKKKGTRDKEPLVLKKKVVKEKQKELKAKIKSKLPED
jgi:hypothetical protein